MDPPERRFVSSLDKGYLSQVLICVDLGRQFLHLVLCSGGLIASRRKRSAKTKQEWEDVLDDRVQYRDPLRVDGVQGEDQVDRQRKSANDTTTTWVTEVTFFYPFSKRSNSTCSRSDPWLK